MPTDKIRTIAVTERIQLNSLQRNWGMTHINRVTERKARHYVVNGKKMPSVTTVLGRTWPKPALYNWYAKRGREAMAEYLARHMGEMIEPGILDSAVAEAKLRPKTDAREAADLGSAAHDLISQELKGEAIVVPAELKAVMEAYHKWYEREDLELLDTETAVYSVEPRPHAGTIDALFKRKDGSYLLVDFKTSKAIYDEYEVQVHAYREALMASLPGNCHMDGQVIRLGKELPDFEIREVCDYNYRLTNLWHTALHFYYALEASKNGV
jgi:hypothetical protein